MRKVLRGVGVGSIGKMAAVLYAAIGLIVGLILASVSSLGGLAGMAAGERGAGLFGMFFGVGAIILCPILYAVIGALVWMLLAVLFNLAAGAIGGIELEVD
jgi:hypothetical protein